MPSIRRLSLLVLGLSLCPVPDVVAQYRILFVGNSFTRGDSDATERTYALGGVPVIFDRLARAGGHTNASVVMRAVGGQDFQFHEQDATSQAAIASQRWDYVLMHTFSLEPTHFVDGIHSIADHMLYGEMLYRRIMSNNPVTRVIVKETWSRAVGHPYVTGITSPTSFASTDEFQAELRTNYLRLVNYLNTAYPTNPPVVLSPVGDAWEIAGGLKAPTDPGFVRLHSSDLWHANDNGSYLSAAVTYCVIYGESPRGFATNPAVASLNLNLTISPALLEDAAWATVRNRSPQSSSSPALEPLAFFREPESLTVHESRSATFRSAVLGSPPYFVTWTRNGVAIPGATNFSYTIASVEPKLDGSAYAVTVSNSFSTVTSTSALLKVAAQPPPFPRQELLFDFGGATITATGPQPNDPANAWNNITTTIGMSGTAQATSLVTSSNQPSGIKLSMLSRFANVNENGTTAFPSLPMNATRDSLYGNTELYSGASNVFPRFKLTGLDPTKRYSFEFYASRMGVTDQRETGYTLEGLNTGFAALEAANNVSNRARVFGIKPTALGEITVSIAPTTNNNNAYHFTYLGMMKLTTVTPWLFAQLGDGAVTLRWEGEAQLESAPSPRGPWTQVAPSAASPHTEPVMAGESRFFRLVLPP